MVVGKRKAGNVPTSRSAMLLTTTITALVVRILIAVSTRTVFQPDEYFQSLEPAHRLVFGYGHLTWEWLSPHPIRSIIYPALNVPVYWVLKATGIHNWGRLGDELVILGPRILHGALAAMTDIGLCILTKRTLGDRYVSTAFFLSITSFFHGLSLSRSLSNSLETSLTTIALSYFPWDVSALDHARTRNRIRKMLVFASLACVIRITNGVIWVYVAAVIAWRLRSRIQLLVGFFLDSFIIGFLALVPIFVLDTLYYGQTTFTPYNFLKTNLSSVSLFYGSNPWHFYFSQAIPILCTTAIPFVLHGGWLVAKSSNAGTSKILLGLLGWTMSIYSLAGHKEWRFIHPLLPILHMLAAKSLVDSSPKDTHHTLPITRQKLVLLLASVPISTYIVLLYCSGPISVMGYIRSLPTDELAGGIGLLMPCHSTPGHAYLHRPQLAHGELWALGCEPPLQNQNISTYQDQTTIFFANPYRYLTERFPSEVDPSFPISPYPASVPGRSSDDRLWRYEWPLHLVFFGSLLEQGGIQELLETKGYREVWRAGRSWEGDGDERKGGVRVWRWIS
ncbi:glycosylphosphatidylinositol anchor biosynthesis [Marasmius tenuissimus]|nr:glycosylphosphatidylinositol anchor biosynthesis [Marasmius tenuissimus]